MASKDPKKQKKLGRKVFGFKQEGWDKVAESFVYEANMAKFTQNLHLLVLLLCTEDTHSLVEASPMDSIWGIKLKADDFRVLQEDTWDGMNLLGQTMTKVRNEILKKLFCNEKTIINKNKLNVENLKFNNSKLLKVTNQNLLKEPSVDFSNVNDPILLFVIENWSYFKNNIEGVFKFIHKRLPEKMSENKEMSYFDSCISPFGHKHISIIRDQNENNLIFLSLNHYLIYNAAKEFGKSNMAYEIYSCKYPADISSLKFIDFKSKYYREFLDKYLKSGIKLKFTQNKHLLAQLLGTTGTLYFLDIDDILGIGIKKIYQLDYAKIKDFKGLNLLGLALTKFRNELIEKAVEPSPSEVCVISKQKRKHEKDNETATSFKR